MKTIFRRIFAAVLAFGVLASAGDLRVSAAGANCDVNHSGASPWNSNYSLSGGEYFFDEAVKLSDEIKISGDVTICLNGKTITAADEHRIFNIQGGSLTLCDCARDGTITRGDVKNYGGDGGTSGGAVYVGNGGKFILMNGNITDSSAEKGGGVYVDSGGEFTMYGGIISDNAAIKNSSHNPPGGDGGGVYVHKSEGGKSRGVFTMSGGTIFNNEAEDQGGGVHVCGNDGKFIMSGGVIKENKSAEGGGVYTGGTFTMSGGNSKIFGNTVSSAETEKCFGGGVCVSGDNAKFTMESGTLSDNKAYNGGGVYVSSSGAVEIEGGTIGSGNEAENGGGVYLASGSGTITINNATISNNKSTNKGGGIYVNGGTLTMSNSVISNNNAEADGGGAFVTGGNFTMNSGSVISGNNATKNGGGVYLNNGNFTMTDGSKIEKNEAVLGRCVFVSNDSNKGGGTMTLNGTVTLTSNSKPDGSKSNVYLASNKVITIGVSFAPTAIIGVHPELPPEDCVHYVPVTMFAGGVNLGDISEKFSPDREKQYILYEGGQVKLRGEHAFAPDKWEVTSETHSNTCTRDGCDYGLITELHNFDGGVITRQPTYTQEGEKTYICVDCHYPKTEPIPLKVSYDDDDDDDYYYDNDDPNSQTAAPYNPQMGIAVSIAPTILAALGVAVIIYRKQNK